MSKKLLLSFARLEASMDALGSSSINARVLELGELARVDQLDHGILGSVCWMALVELLRQGGDIDSGKRWVFSQFEAVDEGVDVDPFTDLRIGELSGKTARFIIRELLKRGGNADALCELIIIGLCLQAPMITMVDEPEPPH